MKRILLSLCVLFSLLLGCDKLGLLNQKKPEMPKPAAQVTAIKGTVIARVNNMPITLEELNQEIESYNAMVPEDKPELKYDTREKKIEFLKNELVRRKLLYQAAMEKGLDKNEDVASALEKTKMDLLVVQLIKQEAEKVEVTSKEIEDYYNAYKEELKEPEELNIREIVVSTEQEGKDVLIQLLQGADFATLARERSRSKSAKNSGDLGFAQKGEITKEIEKAADSLEAGQTSNVFKGPEGYYVIKLEARRGGKQKTLSEMWDDLKRALTFIKQQQQVENLMAKLSQSAKTEIYEGEIK